MEMQLWSEEGCKGTILQEVSTEFGKKTVKEFPNDPVPSPPVYVRIICSVAQPTSTWYSLFTAGR